MENLGDMPFRNVVVELLPGVGELQRGQKPFISEYVRDGVLVKPTVVKVLSPVLSEARAAIFEVELTETRVDVPGPAIVAAPYGDSISLAECEGDNETGLPWVHLDFTTLAWIPPGHSLRSRSCVAHAVIFQFGSTDDASAAVPKVHPPLKKLQAHADEPE